VVLWASAFVAIRSASAAFSPGALALGRLACGSVVLGAVCCARREGWPRRAAWPGIVISGLLWFGVYMVTLNWGEQKVDAGTAAMVVSLGPVIIALVSAWVLKEGLSATLLAGLVVSFTGVVVVGAATSEAGHASVAGVMLCLLAALSFAVAVVAQKPALRHASALQVTTFGAAIGGSRLSPVRRPARVRGYRCASVRHPKDLLPGRLPYAIGFTTWAYALARTPAGKMGATTYLVPALTVVMSWALLGQVPGLLVIAGGVLCLAGVSISRRRPRPSVPRPG